MLQAVKGLLKLVDMFSVNMYHSGGVCVCVCVCVCACVRACV